ncbi:pitrilysin family protein [Brevundimonas sp. SORGH_AS_0993]|uniref:M16 family metallopeptidase n=1 Tax=Brevundimonas sp. SORGH_AS_0993 TaxID=3041794 RepID=UPI002783F882|nr:pitrilysin family protein [Brevundimonas sp. SORGH_AS_0993]MDQ1154749.1 zinc protease [Brevundimonas sp. SORGH_AS_0993]
MIIRLSAPLKAGVAASALLLGLAAPAFAAPAQAPARAAEAAPQGLTVPPLGFARRVLPNGLEVYTSRDPAASNVTVQVWYKVGSKDDPAGRSGFAHLFEHLMFKATRNLPPETFDRLTEDVGGSNNAFTADDTTAYFETVPANHLQRMLFAEADRMGSLVVDEPTFVAERDVVKEEYRQRILATPYGRLFGLFVPETLYKESPYRRPGIGSIEELEASSLDDVRRFHATYYRPDNAYLIVAGNFDQAQLDRWVDQYFTPLKNPTTPIPANHVVEPEPTGPQDVTYHAPNVPLPAVVIGWPTVKYADPDRAALTVLDGVLSTGESSRLYRSLVYDKQIAAQIGSTPDFAQQAGNLTALAIMAQGHTAEEGVAALNVEIAKLRDQPISEIELAEAKNEIVANTLRNRETIDDRASALGYALINTGSAAAADEEVAQIQAVTIADVQRVARKYLTPQRQSTIRYLAADAEHPVSVQKMNVGAPVTVADLAPAGEPAVLLPEAQRTPLPQPGPEVAPATPAVADFRLDNGLRVLVAPTRGLPLVSARLSFRAGSSDDPSGKAGTAALTAGLLTQGTKTRTAPEIATQIEQLGASLGAGAGVDFTNVYANAPANAFPQTVALMADLVRNPTFAAEELERQQAQTLDGLRVALSQPAAIARMTVGRVVYGDAPYGAPGSGTPQTVPAITAADVAAFHAARYRPSEATLVFSGDITPAAARALAQQAFGDWRPAGQAAAPAAHPAGQAQAPRIVVVDQPGAGQAAVVAAIRGVSRTDADYFPLTLGNTLLGGGFSSRLNQEIRIKRGLSYGAGSSLGVRADAGVFTASTQTKNETADEVADLILAEIAKLGTETPTAADLAPRRATLIGGFGRSLETVDGLGALVADLALYDLPISDLADYAGRVRAVTPDQVEAAFARHLPVNQASLVIVGDASKFLDALRAKHPNLEVVPADALNLNAGALK